MSDPYETVWSDSPNAPQIPYIVYSGEKENFAGSFLCAILYGVVVVLFFQCLGAFFDPANRRKGGVKWPLVIHAVAMFLFVTVYTITNLDLQSISYVDDSNFPGSYEEELPPGPIGYQLLTYSTAITIVPNVMVLLNNWLADGLLLYRCYLIYAMNRWVIAFPCLVYLASLGTGTTFIYKTSQPGSVSDSLASNTGIPYFSISISLNILLTLMIIVRLFLHRRNIQNALGPQAGANGMYKAIATMLVESSALYAVTSVLFIGPWSANSWVADTFLPVLAQSQVIAPFLIILRVANQSALTSKTIASGSLSSIHFGDERESSGNSDTLSNVHPTDSEDTTQERPGDIRFGVETVTTNPDDDKL